MIISMQPDVVDIIFQTINLQMELKCYIKES